MFQYFRILKHIQLNKLISVFIALPRARARESHLLTSYPFHDAESQDFVDMVLVGK